MMSRAQAIATYSQQAMDMIEALDNMGLGAFMQAECADHPFLRRHPWGQLFRRWWCDQDGEDLDEHGVVHCGATRVVYTREGCPFVLKIPTANCCHEEPYLPQCTDYCEREAALYATICTDYPEAADCFAGCWKVGSYDFGEGLVVPIYIMEYAYISSEDNSMTARIYVQANWRDIASSDVYRLNKEVYTGADEDGYGYRLFAERAADAMLMSDPSPDTLQMRIFASEQWGERKSMAVTHACSDLDITDLHTGNYGLLVDGDWDTLVITDYAGYFEG